MAAIIIIFSVRGLQRLSAQGKMLQVQGKPDRPSERGADAVSRRGSE